MRMNGKLEVVVGVPNQGLLFEHFVKCLMAMTTYYFYQKVPGFATQGMQVHWTRGSILPRGRLNIVRHAKEVNASHVLFLDSDHTFPADLLHRLVGHDKDVVAINCVTKTIPANPTARQIDPDNPGYGLKVYSDPDTHGLERVWQIGTGIMLVKTAVFRKVGDQVFAMPYREEVNNYQGEDWSLVEALHKHGYDVYIDHDLSRECGHVGFYEYTHDVVGEIVKESDSARSADSSGRFGRNAQKVLREPRLETG